MCVCLCEIAISEKFLGITISFRQKRNVLYSQTNFAQISKNLARYRSENMVLLDQEIKIIIRYSD